MTHMNNSSRSSVYSDLSGDSPVSDNWNSDGPGDDMGSRDGNTVCPGIGAPV
jgi:hypothetical protein